MRVQITLVRSRLSLIGRKRKVIFEENGALENRKFHRKTKLGLALTFGLFWSPKVTFSKKERSPIKGLHLPRCEKGPKHTLLGEPFRRKSFHYLLVPVLSPVRPRTASSACRLLDHPQGRRVSPLTTRENSQRNVPVHTVPFQRPQTWLYPVLVTDRILRRTRVLCGLENFSNPPSFSFCIYLNPFNFITRFHESMFVIFTL